jgi:hypothetical protein
VAEWLRGHYPAAHPVDVRWVPKVPDDEPGATSRERRLGCFGDCQKIGRRFLIRLSRRRCHQRAQAVETLHHEWAHAITWDRAPGHESAMWLAYGRIYRRLHEGSGRHELNIALS